MNLDDAKELKRRLGFGVNLNSDEARRRMAEVINAKLWFRGQPIVGEESEFALLKTSKHLLANLREKNRLLAEHHCPADARIQAFLDRTLEGCGCGIPRLPTNALQLEHHGLARTLSLPPDTDSYTSECLESYRTEQGVLHNPRSDRRTTKGVFHIVEGGLPIPHDKKEVPKRVFAGLLGQALSPPDSVMEIPFTHSQEERARLFVSLLLRPVVMPGVEGICAERSLETRFFAPGSFVANLDFVESIFGNAGDPYLSENDAALDPEHWTGHTGCVVLAPHLVSLGKKELGLPHVSEATDRQKRDGMCWESEEERYNDGGGFKVACRDASGVMVTLIADNYFGYCKKEVKTQISFSANLLGNTEEEHAGGAVAFSSSDLGEDFYLSRFLKKVDHTFDEIRQSYGEMMELQPEGYAIDKRHPDIQYIPEDSHVQLRKQRISWNCDGEEQGIRLTPGVTYVLPSGYKVSMVRRSVGGHWRLVGTRAEGVFCHKPCTVSGGGKSEISKSIQDAILAGPVFVADFHDDMEAVGEILKRNYSGRFKEPPEFKRGRSVLDERRSLGSVVKLLTPSRAYTEEYNDWLESIPMHVKDLVFTIKRFYRPEWEGDWRRYFSVDTVNGQAGMELKYRQQKLVAQYLRVGFTEDALWRTFTLRKDFIPTIKLQREDDISASTVVSADGLSGARDGEPRPSLKFVSNCEFRFFQRPDDAIRRGYDKKAEADFCRENLFASNYHPISRREACDEVADALEFGEYTLGLREVFTDFLDEPNSRQFMVSTARPRIVDGVPTKNPRYLQNRPDVEDARGRYLAGVGTRLYRRVPLGQAVCFPVDAVLAGRRNNPPDPKAGIRALAVYGPIHYQELPELFMDFVSSLTGKSPSTTGAGSEGALTKGPFNALPPVVDLNNALVSYMLTGDDCFTSAAGYIGPKYRVDHDISLLIPELWARMSAEERRASFLISGGYLEKLEDFDHDGQAVLASRLGYRITSRFILDFFGRIFTNPDSVVPPDMLKPELQGIGDYVDGINNIVETQQRIASNYFEDGSVGDAIPPLKALLHIMADGQFEGKTIDDPAVRSLFDVKEVRGRQWYLDRLEAKQERDVCYLETQREYMKVFLGKETHREEAERLGLAKRLAKLEEQLEVVRDSDYLAALNGTLGIDTSLA
ncbi:MAG: hypothetical protein QF721_00210 [Verrucomicrobiota bacterium]|jgi:hypothetical protein|nr:hypothetical protein [Verrucomicrobiota bacterium]MDP7047852.1 hypothetical protein [Verrucomicrobiota bacterium]